MDKMLRREVLDHVQSEWASLIVFAPKKDGLLRLSIDYRKLNVVMVKDAYPIPRVDECLDPLGEVGIFSMFDARFGNWEIEIDDGDNDKTTFASHYGLYRFLRFQFGLKNALSSFQRAMYIIMSTGKWHFALVYLENVDIFFRSLEENMDHLRTVLRLMSSARVSLKLKKMLLL